MPSYRVDGRFSSYVLPRECVEYVELRPPADGHPESTATETLTRFVNSTRGGGGNHAATIVLGQVSFLPAQHYDVFMTLIVEDDPVDRFRSTRKFVM